MKHILHILFTIVMTLSSVGAKAQTEHLCAALNDFLSQKGVKSSSSETINLENPWSVVQYSFTVDDGEKWNVMLQKFVEAYHEDMPGSELAHMADSKLRMNGTAYVFYAKPHSNEPPVVIGADKSYNLIVVRKKNAETNKRVVFAIEWKQRGEAKKSPCEGNIYVISGSLELAKEQLQSEKYKQILGNEKFQLPESSNTQSDYQRRMEFFKEKAQEVGSNEAIVVGACVVAKDILENGTLEDVDAAKMALDVILGGIRIPSYVAAGDLNKCREGQMMQGIIEAQKALAQRTPSAYLRNSNPADNPFGAQQPQASSAAPNEQEAHLAVEKLLANAKEFTKGNFKIIGKKDTELWDVGYYIYKADDDFNFPFDKHDDVRVENDQFHYACDLKDITLGKVNAIMKDGTICSAWMEMPFVPGETANLHVHNGHFSLTGSKFYQEWERADQAGSLEVKEIIKDHIKEYGFLCYVFMRVPLSCDEKQEIWNHLPKSVQTNHIGRFLKKCM